MDSNNNDNRNSIVYHCSDNLPLFDIKFDILFSTNGINRCVNHIKSVYPDLVNKKISTGNMSHSLKHDSDDSNTYFITMFDISDEELFHGEVILQSVKTSLYMMEHLMINFENVNGGVQGGIVKYITGSILEAHEHFTGLGKDEGGDRDIDEF